MGESEKRIYFLEKGFGYLFDSILLNDLIIFLKIDLQSKNIKQKL